MEKLGIFVLLFGTCLAGLVPLQAPAFYSVAPIHNQYYQPSAQPIPHVFYYSIFRPNPLYRTHVIYQNIAPPVVPSVTTGYNYYGPFHMQPPVYPLIPFNPPKPQFTPTIPEDYIPHKPEEPNYEANDRKDQSPAEEPETSEEPRVEPSPDDVPQNAGGQNPDHPQTATETVESDTKGTDAIETLDYKQSRELNNYDYFPTANLETNLQ